MNARDAIDFCNLETKCMIYVVNGWPNFVSIKKTEKIPDNIPIYIDVGTENQKILF